MGIGGQVTALLKREYTSMIEESRSKEYLQRHGLTMILLKMMTI